ncbi:MAG: hypothetical protein A3I89_03355 [Candidatus Harrisonbacteria bacterium RIFCSPLOWO2_02_FULL_41_11]|uniref:Uncharacterized protein n=1 Tax=Candidatus Harrisonbacteria bacterium RIFCSPHIGHO2_02_FULL_42_16 TaxID=1798404 RepID=A0A1G1ZI37_9BACT|nr:MAG: hypothetical protein A3B92_02955 [Candidatus Harrisonbacteria bacterium RIFCSPHIGHO2_02_FULL_42_16]OGY67221.1 MAG: hypothetical protein A3I89_03355 [Candidatus Harrisonbacteria bacterium RIFCSPLOWO2_02_FULL_41_11]
MIGKNAPYAEKNYRKNSAAESKNVKAKNMINIFAKNVPRPVSFVHRITFIYRKITISFYNKKLD